jgi:DNA-binding transcriptional ArsR family regulator
MAHRVPTRRASAFGRGHRATHLERAGIVTSRRSAQRRIYALESGALRELARLLNQLADTTDAHSGDREAFDQYVATVAAETRAADRERWADECVFTFRRTLPAPRETLWRYVTEPALLSE